MGASVPRQPEFTSLDPAALAAQGKSMYALMISGVVPRPIAFVSTLSETGCNLAPFSYFGLMCHDPPTLAFCTTARAGRHKDTLANVLRTGECVVNMIDETFVEAANHCSGEYAADVDEFELSGLTKLASVALPRRTPRVAESMFQMECTLVETKDLVGAKGDVSATIIIVRITMCHVHKAVHRTTPNGSDYIEVGGDYQPISRLGGNDYARVAGQFTIQRPPADPTKWTPPTEKKLE
jgi:flavin reductase (DIM6/NTAB) family NADH-FMN oxidoreductase RutF